MLTSYLSPLVVIALVILDVVAVHMLITVVRREGVGKRIKSINQVGREKILSTYFQIMERQRKHKIIGRWIVRFEINYIERSNVKKMIPGYNLLYHFMVTLAVFIVGMKVFFRMTETFIPTMTISVLLALTPTILLDFMKENNAKVVRQNFSSFISNLNRWCRVKEDIVYAFDKSRESGIREPLDTFVNDFVLQVNLGVDVLDALDILQIKVDSDYFRNFIINVKKTVENRGDILILLDNMELEAFKLEEEYNRRHISTMRDRAIIYTVMICELVISYFFITMDPYVWHFYTGTEFGQALLSLYCIFYFIGFMISNGLTKFEY